MATEDGKAPTIDEKIMIAIVRVSERFKRKSSAIFADYNLSFSQYNLLRVLERMPEGRGSISEVSTRMLVSTPNLSGIAKRLEKTGYLVRRRDETDERRTLLELQPPGRLALERIRDLQEANVKSFLDASPANQKQAWLNSLKRMLRPDG